MPTRTGRRLPVTPDEVDHQFGSPTAYTIREFCRAHRISIGFYYKLRAQGLTPAELRLGSRVLITTESAEAWRIEHTQTATTAA
jgi:hypothetical protein